MMEFPYGMVIPNNLTRILEYLEECVDDPEDRAAMMSDLDFTDVTTVIRDGKAVTFYDLGYDSVAYVAARGEVVIETDLVSAMEDAWLDEMRKVRAQREQEENLRNIAAGHKWDQRLLSGEFDDSYVACGLMALSVRERDELLRKSAMCPQCDKAFGGQCKCGLEAIVRERMGLPSLDSLLPTVAEIAEANRRHNEWAKKQLEKDLAKENGE